MKFRRMTVGLFVALLMLLGVSALYGERYWSINHDTITNPAKLEVVMNRQDQTLDENTTLSTELRTDAATHRTFELEAKADLLTDYTAITNLNNATHELTDDAATNRTFLLELQTDAVTQGTFNTNVKATAGELADDAATNRTAIVNLKATAGEAADDLGTDRTAIVNLKNTAGEAADDLGTNRTAIVNLKNTAGEVADDMGSMRTAVLAMKNLGSTGDFAITATAIAIGSNPTRVAMGSAFSYMINGETYYEPAYAVGVALTPCSNLIGGQTKTIPDLKTGAFRIIIGTDHVYHAQQATGNGTGYDTTDDARAGLPSIDNDHAGCGWVFVTNNGATFVPGTTALNAGTVTDEYHNGNTLAYYMYQATAPAAAMQYTSATLTNPAAVMTYTSGTLTNPAAAMTYTSGTLTNPAAAMTYTSGTLTNGPTQPMTASPAAAVTYTGTLTNPAPEMTASPPAATTAPAPTDRVSRGK